MLLLLPSTAANPGTTTDQALLLYPCPGVDLFTWNANSGAAWACGRSSRGLSAPLPSEWFRCHVKCMHALQEYAEIGTQKCMPQKNSRRKAHTHNSQNSCWRFTLNINSILMRSCQCVKHFSCSVCFPTPDSLLAGNHREARISRAHTSGPFSEHSENLPGVHTPKESLQ